MKIELIGHVDIDHNKSEGVTYTAAGSPPMFMHRVLRRFPGVRVGVVASYGADYTRYLEAQGVDIYPPRPNISGQTLIYKNTSYPDGTRDQKAYNRVEALPVALDRPLQDKLRRADIIVLAPILPNISPAYVKRIADIAGDNVLKVLLPQGYYRDFDKDNNVIPRRFREADRILSNVDLMIVSEQDDKDMIKTAEKWAKRYDLISVVTLGERGAVAFSSLQELYIPAVPLPESDIVDSVGSGDIFSAGFAYWLRQTGSIEEAGKRANALARECLLYSVADLDKAINLRVSS